MPTAGVHDDYLKALILEHVHTVTGDDGGVHLGVAAVERDTGLGGVLFQLVVSSSCVKRGVQSTFQ